MWGVYLYVQTPFAPFPVYCYHVSVTFCGIFLTSIPSSWVHYKSGIPQQEQTLLPLFYLHIELNPAMELIPVHQQKYVTGFIFCSWIKIEKSQCFQYPTFLFVLPSKKCADFINMSVVIYKYLALNILFKLFSLLIMYFIGYNHAIKSIF